MSCYKIILATAAIIFVFTIANINKTIAGEKQRIQAYDPSYKTKIHKLDVGDDEGHVIVIFENKSVFPGNIADENMPESSVG
jgi:beta-glucosidase-like glycosyl hydrolase